MIDVKKRHRVAPHFGLPENCRAASVWCSNQLTIASFISPQADAAQSVPASSHVRVVAGCEVSGSAELLSHSQLSFHLFEAAVTDLG